jgi:hypothetical protein
MNEMEIAMSDGLELIIGAFDDKGQRIRYSAIRFRYHLEGMF